jgi:hypothetical protein
LPVRSVPRTDVQWSQHHPDGQTVTITGEPSPIRWCKRFRFRSSWYLALTPNARRESTTRFCPQPQSGEALTASITFLAPVLGEKYLTTDRTARNPQEW